MASDDDEWLPPPPPKPKPKNFAMLKGKKKKSKQLAKTEFDCPHCTKRFPSKLTLKNHSKAVHGKN